MHQEDCEASVCDSVAGNQSVLLIIIAAYHLVY